MRKIAAGLTLAGSLLMVAVGAFMVLYARAGIGQMVHGEQLRSLAMNEIRVVFAAVTVLGLAGLALGIALLLQKGRARTLVFVSAGLLAVASLPAGYFSRSSSPPPDTKPINEMPMYGGVPPTPEIQAANEAFIKQVSDAVGSRAKAAEISCQKGWILVDQGETATAMRRFNQAWLLDPSFEGPYWGFGAILGMLGDINGSVQMLEKAYAINNHDPRLLTDLGRSLAIRGRQETPQSAPGAAAFKRAEQLFHNALVLNPKYEPVYAQRAIALFYKEDYVGAWKNAHASQKLGGKSLDPKFMDALKAKMKDPEPAKS
jgi:tetratricopeptide (TPR) repeat protein